MWIYLCTCSFFMVHQTGANAVTSCVTRMHDILNFFSYFRRWLDSAKHFIELHWVLNDMIEVIASLVFSLAQQKQTAISFPSSQEWELMIPQKIMKQSNLNTGKIINFWDSIPSNSITIKKKEGSIYEWGSTCIGTHSEQLWPAFILWQVTTRMLVLQ